MPGQNVVRNEGEVIGDREAAKFEHLFFNRVATEHRHQNEPRNRITLGALQKVEIAEY